MRLGLSSWAFAWAVGVPGSEPEHPLTAVGLLRRADTLGVRLVQFADNLPLHRLSSTELDEVEVEARRLEIAIEVGTRGISRENLETYLELARRFSSPILRVVLDTSAQQPAPEEVVSLLRPLVNAFERAAVTLAIENHDRFPCRTLVDIIRRLESRNVGICLDTVNSFGCLESPDVVVSELGPYTVNLHVKDFKIRRPSHSMGFLIEGAPAGQGRLDVPWVLRTLKEMGRDVNAILEQWPSPEASLDQTIAKESRWAEESVRYLRTLITE